MTTALPEPEPEPEVFFDPSRLEDVDPLFAYLPRAAAAKYVAQRQRLAELHALVRRRNKRGRLRRDQILLRTTRPFTIG